MRAETSSSEPPRRCAESGFSLIDVCVTLFVCVVVIFALHSGTRTAMETRKSVERNYQLQLFSNDFVGRLRRLPFGNPGAPTIQAAQLDALFDADQDLGTASFIQLRVPATHDGHSFLMAGNDFTEAWRVRVTNDLNGDGDTNDEREGRDDLLRIEIYYDNRLLVETLRGADANLTAPDITADYLVGAPPIPDPRNGGGNGGGDSGSKSNESDDDDEDEDDDEDDADNDLLNATNPGKNKLNVGR